MKKIFRLITKLYSYLKDNDREETGTTVIKFYFNFED